MGPLRVDGRGRTKLNSRTQHRHPGRLLAFIPLLPQPTVPSANNHLRLFTPAMTLSVLDHPWSITNHHPPTLPPEMIGTLHALMNLGKSSIPPRDLQQDLTPPCHLRLYCYPQPRPTICEKVIRIPICRFPDTRRIYDLVSLRVLRMTSSTRTLRRHLRVDVLGLGSLLLNHPRDSQIQTQREQACSRDAEEDGPNSAVAIGNSSTPRRVDVLGTTGRVS